MLLGRYAFLLLKVEEKLLMLIAEPGKRGGPRQTARLHFDSSHVVIELGC